MAEDEDVAGARIENDAVRTALNLNRLDRRQSLAVPHDNGIAAGKSVPRHRIDGGAVDPLRVGDHAHRSQGIEVKHRNAVSPGNIQVPRRCIGSDVVKTALAADLGGIDDLIRGIARRAGRDGEEGAGRSKNEDAGKQSFQLGRLRIECDGIVTIGITILQTAHYRTMT